MKTWVRLSRALGKLIDQLARTHIEAARDAQDRRQPGLARSALQSANRGRMHIGLVGQIVLREPMFELEVRVDAVQKLCLRRLGRRPDASPPYG